MYYCNLKIHLITCNEMDETIEKVRPMENFSHEFITHDKLGEIEADDVNEDTVIIVNDDKNWSLVELAKYKRYGAIIVLVTNQPEVFMESELMMFDYIWTLPLTPNLMRYYFRKLQNDLKIAKDFWLNKNFLDSLTKLTNRQYFYEYIAENRGDNFMTICYVDLENLDTVNDKFGHSVGDAALTSTADILRTTFPDELVTRLGGDEFVVTIVGEYPRADLIARLNFLISETAKLYEKNEEFKSLVMNIGVATTDNTQLSVDNLLQMCEEALHYCKTHNSGGYIFYDEFKDKILAERSKI